MVPVAGVHHDAGRLPVERAEYDALLRERQHQEEVLQRLADPSSAEGRVVQKALQRMTELVDNLNLDDAHIELAQEVCLLLHSGRICFHSDTKHVHLEHYTKHDRWYTTTSLIIGTLHRA